MRSLFLFFFLFVSLAQAQNFQVHGIITDRETKQPVPYATIQLIHSFTGTASNDIGEFSFNITSISDSIKISSIGYVTVTLPVEADFMQIELEPKALVLKSVLIASKQLDPKKIVKKAVRKIRQNYIKSPVKLNTFYRHYCRDDSTYGRLIEAAIDLYKPKGYGRPESPDEKQDKYHLVQLRRSLDKTKLKAAHSPFAFDLILNQDLVAYQVSHSEKDKFQFTFVSPEHKMFRDVNAYTFDLAGLSTYSGKDVYVINYQTKVDSLVSEGGVLFQTDHHGTFYIQTDNYAFVKIESFQKGMTNEHAQIFYKSNGEQYFLSHVIYNLYYPRSNHDVNISLLVNDIHLGKDKAFYHEPIAGRSLETAEYDRQFWENYNTIKDNPLEESIIEDLGGELQLKEEFKAVAESSKENWKEVELGEQAFEKLLANENHEIIYIDFWASWCSPCISEFIKSKKTVDEYREKGVRFVYISIDKDSERWHKIKTRFGLENSEHYRIGASSNILLEYKIDAIPRYFSIDPKGRIISDAPRPSSKEFKLMMESQLLLLNKFSGN